MAVQRKFILSLQNKVMFILSKTSITENVYYRRQKPTKSKLNLFFVAICLEKTRKRYEEFPEHTSKQDIGNPPRDTKQGNNISETCHWKYRILAVGCLRISQENENSRLVRHIQEFLLSCFNYRGEFQEMHRVNQLWKSAKCVFWIWK